MTTEQKREAIEQLKIQCDLKMEGYEGLSARSGLYELGYSNSEVQEVIEYIAVGGFDYCLDSSIKAKSYSGDKVTEGYPPTFACWWGPDQLKSRLNCLWWKE